MKRIIFCLIFLSFQLSSIKSFSQCDSIFYTITNEVAIKITDYLDKVNDAPKQSYYGIWNTNGDTTSVLITRYIKTDKKVGSLINSSNRFIKVKKGIVIPLVLKPDLLFSENLNVIENRDKKNESVTTTTVTVSGFLIIFCGRYKNMTIVKSGYFQF